MRSTSISSAGPRRRHPRSRRSRCARARRSCRCSRCRCRTDAIGWCTSIRSIPRGRIRPTRFASSRSAAPTCSGCTCGVIRNCGSGCIGGGAMPDAGPLLVVSPNRLGDAVMALPAIADLKRHFADRRMIVAARASVSSLFTMVPDVERVVTADVAAIRDARPSVAVLFPNSFASAWLVWRAGVRERWGYARDFRRRLLTRAVRPPKQPMHQGEYYQHLVRELGVATGPLEPTLSIGADALDDAKRLLAQHGWEEGSLLIVLAPGAAYGKAKQWIPSHVTWLVTDLVRERGVTCALVGSRADAQTTRAIRDAVPVDCQPKVLDLAGETRLPVLAAVMSVAAACVS